MIQLKALAAYLLPEDETTHRKAVAVELAQLVNAFPKEQMGDRERQHRFEAFQRSLADIPIWALARAREDIIAGKIKDLDQKWCPTPPQLRTISRRYMAQAERDQEDLRTIRDAPVLGVNNPEDSQLIIDGFADLKAELRQKSIERQRRDEAELAALAGMRVVDEALRVRDCIAAGVDPDLNCSAALAKKLGVKRHDKDDENYSDGAPPGNAAFDH